MAAVKFADQEFPEQNCAIYNKQKKVFLDISSHEDPQGKLKSFLLSNFSFDGKRILEAGAGAGRITDYYIDRAGSVILTDANKPMVDILTKKYGAGNNAAAVRCLHKDLKKQFSGTFDIFLCAFSFGYGLEPEIRDYDSYLEKILPAARQHIIIECTGIYDMYDCLDPETILFDQALERRFQKKEILTDFVFPSPEQAYEAAGILFPAVAERVKQENRAVIPDRITVFYD
ncbi:MAG: class I SAM-dependent methyltransferase [Anaerolineaceae bacterium]|nr:class I SAM-dependent methyltransferase [Anaerolineaceae bacterium]